MRLRPRLIWILSGLLASVALPAGALGPLNDTGIQFCGAATDGNGPCDGSQPAGQDAHYGRDAQAAAGTLTKIGGGSAGFDFTKIANNGSDLPASATLGSGPTDWACTRDNVTGLIWEVKTDDNGFRDRDWGYTWYDTDSPDGDLGEVGDTSTCNNTMGGQPCNTEGYVGAVNALGLCGAHDWRMPQIKELFGIVDRGRTVQPLIDPVYFPNTPRSFFWSGSPNANSSSCAWNLEFDYGNSQIFGFRSYADKVRLVRGGR
ncbi:DUF1566 domain-containing protein [Thiocystis violacea]|uniref:Lcl C-terminal domain-containing protein n=1 Tax=Thiocystis violacea TaxID=13725 RepID=UPI001903396A|nr:DUF1566 domain-containing protein [Thiocystis violacea]MBK1723019.1 hypothetical protein [Thiocystis violacea]